MISLENLIIGVLNEMNTAAGALGAPAGGTSQFSGDTYAPGDSRIPHSLFGGKIFRRNISTSKRKKKKRKNK